ncbi:MAG: response regulator [Candidatus Omnitrophica bacterium]|nr:response regulator [Candidatus Omnitrophota bacterium]
MDEKRFKAKILVADDEESVREVLKTFFVRKEYDVETASQGREAIEKIESYKPDILLLDLKMPDMDGEEVLKYINDSNLKIGVIIITGHPDFIKDRKLLNRAYDYIVKPFDLDYLNNTVLTKVVLLSE